MKLVISQSMYFPWVGLLEQLRLADVYLHYDDVQYARGFYNRVQVKTQCGMQWMTVPLRNHHRGQRIDEVMIDNSVDWQRQHRSVLTHAYAAAEYRNEMLSLVDEVFSKPCTTLSEVSRESVLALSRYFGLTADTEFDCSSRMGISGASSQRLHDLCRKVGADVYITGHGAKNYLDHELFERSGISVEYMRYAMRPYPQLHGEFTPFVTSLDLVANCGKAGASVICSGSVNWKEFLREPN